MIPRLKRQTKKRQKRVRVKHLWLGDQTIDLDLAGSIIPLAVKNMRVVTDRKGARVRYFMERRGQPVDFTVPALTFPIIGARLSPDVWAT